MVAKTELTPPAAVAKAAKRGLELRKEHGRGGTEVGVKRAEQLAARHVVTREDVKAMHSYFARHTADKQGAGWADEDKPSAGYIAWLLWGGDDGKAWVDKLHDKVDEIPAGGDTAHKR